MIWRTLCLFLVRVTIHNARQYYTRRRRVPLLSPYCVCGLRKMIGTSKYLFLRGRKSWDQRLAVIGHPLFNLTANVPPLPLTPFLLKMSPPSSPKIYTCPHQCGCNFTSRKAGDVAKHTLIGIGHPNCTPQCPSHHLLARNNPRAEIPQSTSTKQSEPQKLPVTQEPPLSNQGTRHILDPTKRMLSCEDTDDESTTPEKSIWESGLLSNSPTPPRQIAPRKTGDSP